MCQVWIKLAQRYLQAFSMYFNAVHTLLSLIEYVHSLYIFSQRLFDKSLFCPK